MSGANWNALNPVTTSKAASSQGSRSRVPTRRSAPGTAARASVIIASAASMPWTAAPRVRASATSSPLPQATSSNVVPGPTPSAVSTASQAGRERSAKCSARTAAPADHRLPYVSATPVSTTPLCHRPETAHRTSHPYVLFAPVDGVRRDAKGCEVDAAGLRGLRAGPLVRSDARVRRSPRCPDRSSDADLPDTGGRA